MIMIVIFICQCPARYITISLGCLIEYSEQSEIHVHSHAPDHEEDSPNLEPESSVEVCATFRHTCILSINQTCSPVLHVINLNTLKINSSNTGIYLYQTDAAQFKWFFSCAKVTFILICFPLCSNY